MIVLQSLPQQTQTVLIHCIQGKIKSKFVKWIYDQNLKLYVHGLYQSNVNASDTAQLIRAYKIPK